MANNRLYLKCDECGELFMLGKHFGGAWGIVNYDELPFLSKLDLFFEKHFLTCRNNNSFYSIVSENDKDFTYKNTSIFNPKEPYTF